RIRGPRDAEALLRQIPTGGHTVSTGIVLDTTFDNPSLPTAEPYGERIRQLSGIHAWSQPDRQSATVEDGKFASFANLGSGSSALAQATAGNRASVAAKDLAGYDVAALSRDAICYYQMTGDALDLN